MNENELAKKRLYYFNARYYDATIGRFINVDPIQDGLNWYVYANNNPLNRVDPTGLDDYKTTPSSIMAYKDQEKNVSEYKAFVSNYDERKADAGAKLQDAGLISNPIFRGYYSGPEWNGGVKGDDKAFTKFPMPLDSVDKLAVTHDRECLDPNTKNPYPMGTLAKADLKLALGFTEQLIKPVTAVDTNTGKVHEVPLKDEIGAKAYSFGGALGFYFMAAQKAIVSTVEKVTGKKE